ncbi:zinc-binding metallopeptidase family protein [Flavitalea flava]
MKVYTCSNCQNPLYFENSQCLNCGHEVGFDPVNLTMITLAPVNQSPGKPDSVPGTKSYSNAINNKELYQYCRNAEYATCNWLIPAVLTVPVVANNSLHQGSVPQGSPPQDSSPDEGYCIACALNRVIPDLNNEENLRRWKNMEVAKHRLIYSLLRLHLPFRVKKGKPENGQTDQINGAELTGQAEEFIEFDFMADTPTGEKVMTGHDNGVITINIEEADEAERVRHKRDLGERYRTLLGHFRHEIGHFYWDALIMDGSSQEKFRQLFGDERMDYTEALKTYYANGAPADWNQHFISPYATSHPWEDWAETWAHYLHMMDTLETAWAFGIHIDPVELETEAGMKTKISQDPYDRTSFDRLIKGWIPLCFAVNSLNRSMGHPDFYPFIISARVIEKLRFIHEVCHSKT